MDCNPYDYIEKIVLKTLKHKGIYKKYNLSRNPFLDYAKPLRGIYDCLFTGREKEIDSIVNNIISELQTNQEDIAVIGPHGVGTRTIVNFIGNYFLTRILQKENLSPELQILRESLAEVDDREVCYYGPDQRDNLSKRMKMYSAEGKNALITSFFCDEHIYPLQKINKYNESTMDTYSQMLNIDAKVMGEIIFLSSWHAFTFAQFYLKEPQLAQKYKYIEIIEPMTNKEIESLLLKRINYCKIKEKKEDTLFSKDAINSIALTTGGYPRFALELSYRVIKKAIDDKLTKITGNYVENYLKKFKESQKDYDYILFPFIQVEKAVKAIEKERNQGKTLKRIIGIMIGLGGKEIVSADIAERLKMTRPAVHKALNRIKTIEKYFKIQILRQHTTEKDFRKRPYELNPFFWTVFEQTYVIPEVKRLLNNEKIEWIE
jgi:hypothetical protein